MFAARRLNRAIYSQPSQVNFLLVPSLINSQSFVVRSFVSSHATFQSSPASSVTNNPSSAASPSSSSPSVSNKSAPTTAQLITNRAVSGSKNKFDDSTHHDQLLPHPIWTQNDLVTIEQTRRPPQGVIDWLALITIKVMRFNFDWMSGWNRTHQPKNTGDPNNPPVHQALNRIVFLETVAGVPGSIAGTLRHLASLRRMRRDHGWINMLLGEAENERMHLLTALELKQPTRAFKSLVWLTQGIFFNFFWMAYLVSPRYCHRMVGYLEEEAVATYTKILQRIDDGTYKEWQTEPAPLIAIRYWKLPETATMRDVISVIRADESHHRDVNHHFADIPADALGVYKRSPESSESGDVSKQ